jgi:hypothetical protein
MLAFHPRFPDIVEVERAGQPRSVRAAACHSEYGSAGGSTIGDRTMLFLRFVAFLALLILSLAAMLLMPSQSLQGGPPSVLQKNKQRRSKDPALASSFADGKRPLSEEGRLELIRLFRASIAARPKPEPLDKPKTWTKREYLLGLNKAKIWQKLMDNPNNLYSYIPHNSFGILL